MLTQLFGIQVAVIWIFTGFLILMGILSFTLASKLVGAFEVVKNDNQEELAVENLELRKKIWICEEEKDWILENR